MNNFEMFFSYILKMISYHHNKGMQTLKFQKFTMNYMINMSFHWIIYSTQVDISLLDWKKKD